MTVARRAPLIFDLPPWFLHRHRPQLEEVDWSVGLAEPVAASFCGVLRTVTIVCVRRFEDGKFLLAPVEADRTRIFREEFLLS